MRRSVVAVLLAAAFAGGALTGIAVAKKKETLDPGVYVDRSPGDATEELLAHAIILAGEGSWENIAVGRVQYLSGRKEEAKLIFDRVLDSSKVDPGDVIRVARVYEEAGEWDRSRELFDRTLSLAPNDEDWLAEIGAYYNIHGDRQHAEELFKRCFAQGTKLKNVLAAAGSYAGVPPRRK